MTHQYPRQRRRICTINGGFDDFHDATWSAARWFFAGTNGTRHVWSIVSAPGGVGGNALKLVTTPGTSGSDVSLWGGVSPYPHESYLYGISPRSPYKHKIVYEFRMYIEADYDTGVTNFRVALGAGFALDGHVVFEDGNAYRSAIWFNVDSQKAGFTADRYPATSLSQTTLWDWSGSYNTWYDVRVEQEFSWFAKADWKDGSGDDGVLNMTITTYVNNTQLWTITLNFSNYRAGGYTVASYHAALGRCGPATNSYYPGGYTPEGDVVVYYKDILITSEVKLIEYDYRNSIVAPHAETTFKGVLLADDPLYINEGDDLQLWLRKSTSDDWSCQFRGIIRHVESLRKRLFIVEAEGYISLIRGEKAENLTYTTQTTGYIVDDIIGNQPTKYLFDTSTFFDTTSTTYTRAYTELSKFEVLFEMMNLEDYILFLDGGNCWHYQSIESLATTTHLVWGSSKIIQAQKSNIFTRKPNVIRVQGTGFYAEKELAAAAFSAGAKVIRNINRYDLDTQAEVDAALNYYISLYEEETGALELVLAADYSIEPGQVIKVSVPRLGLIQNEYLVRSVHSSNKKRMSLFLLELRPHLAALISETTQRTDTKESEAFPSDIVEDRLHIYGDATLLVTAYYRVYYPYSTKTVVREGQAIITDYCLEFILKMLNAEDITSSEPLGIAIGDGTTEAQTDDTALESEDARASSTNQQDCKKIHYNTTGYHYLAALHYCEGIGSLSNQDISEIGLFNNAVSGGDMFVRATFSTYQAVSTANLGVEIWIKITPLPSASCVIAMDLIDEITDGFVSPSNPQINIQKIHLAGVNTFTIPNPYMNREPEPSTASGPVTVVPGDPTKGTLARTKSLAGHSILFNYTYSAFKWAERYPVTALDRREAWLGLGKGSSDANSYAMLFHRGDKDLSDYEDYDCDWSIKIKLKRGDLNPDPLESFETP